MFNLRRSVFDSLGAVTNLWACSTVFAGSRAGRAAQVTHRNPREVSELKIKCNEIVHKVDMLSNMT